ncbi:MAG: hypothetical protein WCI09_09700 [Planctomycetota bacterium]
MHSPAIAPLSLFVGDSSKKIAKLARASQSLLSAKSLLETAVGLLGIAPARPFTTAAYRERVEG